MYAFAAVNHLSAGCGSCRVKVKRLTAQVNGWVGKDGALVSAAVLAERMWMTASLVGVSYGHSDRYIPYQKTKAQSNAYKVRGQNAEVKITTDARSGICIHIRMLNR